jgi:hypothetical protein
MQRLTRSRGAGAGPKIRTESVRTVSRKFAMSRACSAGRTLSRSVSKIPASAVPRRETYAHNASYAAFRETWSRTGPSSILTYSTYTHAWLSVFRFRFSALLVGEFRFILRLVEASHFEETKFFAAIAASTSRALLIGRRALVALGLPLLTRDYDYWIHIDDVVAFNSAVSSFDLQPNHSAEEARARGRYTLQNDEKVDVLVARSVYTVDRIQVAFEDVWARRRMIEVAPGVQVLMPSLDDLILTKRFGARPKDAEDIRMLEALRSQQA